MSYHMGSNLFLKHDCIQIVAVASKYNTYIEHLNGTPGRSCVADWAEVSSVCRWHPLLYLSSRFGETDILNQCLEVLVSGLDEG